MKQVFAVSSVEQYEELAASVELTVQQLIQAHNYNTIGNFIRFYEEFRVDGGKNLRSFFRSYKPPITPEHHTCVGLGLELLGRLKFLQQKYPALSDKFYLVSCEEAIDDMQGYIRTDPSAVTCEKEHVLVALKIQIGSRSGVLLLDPGYHIGRVVTIMRDHVYPHTGWFTQSDEPHVRKEYCYVFSENPDYIKWIVKETREGIERTSDSAIYIAKPYMTPVHVTERRNLVYNFRSLLARDTKGHLVAGVYFPVKDGGNCVLFYQDGNRKQKMRIPLINCTRDKVEQEVIRRCGLQLGLPPGGLHLILEKIGRIFSDTDFLKQILDINRDINGISQDN